MQLIKKKDSYRLKDTFNLAKDHEKKIRPRSVLLLLLAAAVLIFTAKFALIDRLEELDRVRCEAEDLQQQAQQLKDEIEKMETASKDYAHYTDEEMTEDELNLADRTKILSLVSKRILPYAKINSWSLDGNVLRIYIDRTSLKKVNRIVTGMDGDDMVDYSFMQTAAADNEEITEGSEVTAQMTVYLETPDVSGGAFKTVRNSVDQDPAKTGTEEDG